LLHTTTNKLMFSLLKVKCQIHKVQNS